MKMAGGGRGRRTSRDSSTSTRSWPQAHEYAPEQRGARCGLQDAQHAGAHPSDAHRARRRAAAWVATGEYDRILRGEYIRRGPETAAAAARGRLRRRGQLLRRRGPRDAGSTWSDAAKQGRGAGTETRSGTRRSRESSWSSAAAAASTRSAGPSAASIPPPTSIVRPGNPGTAELATNLAISADRHRPPRRCGGHATAIDLTVIGPGGAPRAGPRRPAAGRGTCGLRTGRRGGAASRHRRRSPRKSCRRRASPPPRAATFDDLDAALAVRGPSRRAAGGEGLGPRGRQGRRGVRHPRGGRAARCAPCWARADSARPAARRRHRGVPRGRGALGPRDHRRTRSASSCPPRRTTSGCGEGDTGPTPAAWAPTARCRSPRPRCSSGCGAKCCSRRFGELAP